MVITAKAERTRATRPAAGGTALRNDILWDDDPDPNEACYASDPTPLGPGAERQLVRVGASGAASAE